ncbi:MAG: hypothetical protein NTV22_15725, partial [bacterium]|nr:hypothetical protein [bacterium]
NVNCKRLTPLCLRSHLLQEAAATQSASEWERLGRSIVPPSAWIANLPLISFASKQITDGLERHRRPTLPCHTIIYFVAK